MEPILKKDIKLDKILKKSKNSRSQPIQRRQFTNNSFDQASYDKIVNDRDTKFDTEYLDPVNQLIKAKQWWANIDSTYFRPIKLKNILLTRDITSAQKLVNYFSHQPQLQKSYQSEQIFEYYPHLGQNIFIQVIFKFLTPFVTQLCTFSFANYTQNQTKKGGNPSKQQNQQTESLKNFSISSCIKNKSSSRIQIQASQQNLQQALKIGNFQFEASLSDGLLLCKIQRAQQTKYKMQHEQDINVELELWDQQVQRQNSQNSILWNNLLSNYSNSIETQFYDFSSEVSLIKQSLMHHTILRYMQHGTKDKTQKMLDQLLQNMKQLKPLKTRESSNKKFFQTDCKICFCSFNNDSNQVLYCDMCNTSFHLACYGLHQVPQEKEYFCDRCTAIKKEEKLTGSRKITCQICCKPNFPIKLIDGHYYHMTCLILFNFVTIRKGMIELRQGLNHQAIIKKVIQSQIQCKACIFCVGNTGAEMGMQFRCTFKDCDSSMHPICAYINGCEFNVLRKTGEKEIEVGILCNKHDCKRDYIQQSYLRRYMCNFKNTSQKSLQSFRAEYNAENLSRKQKLDSRLNDLNALPKILVDTKVVKRHISLKQQKKIEKNDDNINTETRKIFQKLVKSHL